MITVSDVEAVRERLLDIFPDAVRGSVCKSKWGSGQRQLHLSYWVASDTVGGNYILAKRGLYYFFEWDTNEGHIPLFAEGSKTDIVARVRDMFHGECHMITKIVGQS